MVMLSCGLDGRHGSLRFPNIVSVFLSFRSSEWETKEITVLSRNGTNGSDSKNSDWRSQPNSNNIHLCNTCGTHQTHVQGMLLILWKVWMIKVKWFLLGSLSCWCLSTFCGQLRWWRAMKIWHEKGKRPHLLLGVMNESNGGAVVRALSLHQCGLGSIRRGRVICRLSLLVLFSAQRGFFPGCSGFPLSSKTYIWFDFSSFQFNW